MKIELVKLVLLFILIFIALLSSYVVIRLKVKYIRIIRYKKNNQVFYVVNFCNCFWDLLDSLTLAAIDSGQEKDALITIRGQLATLYNYQPISDYNDIYKMRMPDRLFWPLIFKGPLISPKKIREAIIIN